MESQGSPEISISAALRSIRYHNTATVVGAMRTTCVPAEGTLAAAVVDVVVVLFIVVVAVFIFVKDAKG
jgi:hypothetical protein